ncbi:MAG TPA: hypothetical protein PLI95_30335 [Polyangiaceae bacterium]|nr:hypothetical protein [Polyangiaceae bacterium]
MTTTQTTENTATIQSEPKPKPRRKTPTQRQVEALTVLDDDALIAKALDAIFALNRRAKKIRDTRNEYRRASFSKALEHEMEAIYGLKDEFLAVMVLVGRAKVFVFEVERQDGWYCACCGRYFYSSDPECFGCGCDAEPDMEVEDWYLVDCGGHYRFHQPQVPEQVAALATEIESHDPTQPQREIPEIDLTIEAQKTCVRIATERLKTATSGKAA